MSDAITAVIFIVALLIGLPVLILWLRDRIAGALRARRNPPETTAADRRAYEQRLLRPDWDFYERHLQRPAPLALRELYVDWQLATAQDLAYGDNECITTFGPLDMEGSLDTRPCLGLDAVAIATNQVGDPIYLRPGVSEADTVLSRIMTEAIPKSSRSRSPRCLRDSEMPTVPPNGTHIKVATPWAPR